MTRDVRTDFDRFAEYLGGATFKPLLSDRAFVSSTKSLHKVFLAFLTLNAELTDPRGDAHALFIAKFGKKGRSYLQEVASDLGQAIFCFCSGAYKASLVTTRSSIESFAKAFSAAAEPSILSKKSVYEVFDVAKGVPFFASGPAKQCFSEMRAIYDSLNLYVHTVTESQMFQLLSLGVFPHFDSARAVPIRDILFKLTRTMTFCISISLRDEWFKIHYRNRDIVLGALTSSQRVKLNTK